MDIQRKAIEESNNVNPDWSFKFDEELQQYVAVDFEMTNQVDEFNDHWDTFRAGWDAKAQAVPDGFVVVPKEPTDAMLFAASGRDIVAEHYGDENILWPELRETWKAMIEAQEPAND